MNKKQIKKEEEIKGKVLEFVKLYPWSNGAIVLHLENNEFAVFELYNFEDSLHMSIMIDDIYEIWDFDALYHVSLINREEYEKRRDEHRKDLIDSRYKWYLELKKEFEPKE